MVNPLGIGVPTALATTEETDEIIGDGCGN
jgi:hypothetical protein